MSNVSLVENVADQVQGEASSDSYAWGTVKTVLMGDFYDDPTILGLGIRAAVGCVPVVGQVMDLADTGAWICLAYEKGIDDTEVMLNGLILFVGYVPGAGDVLRNLMKGLVSNSAVKGMGELLEKLAYTVGGDGYVYLKEMVIPNLDKWVGEAIDVAKKTLSKVDDLLLEVRKHIPNWMGKDFEIFQKFVKELQDKVDEGFREALKIPREKLDDMMAHFKKADKAVDAGSRSVAVRADPVSKPPQGEGIRAKTSARQLTRAEIIARRRRFLTDKEYAQQVVDDYYKHGKLTEGFEVYHATRIDTRSSLPDGFKPNPERQWQTGSDFVHFSLDSDWGPEKYFPYTKRYEFDPAVHKPGQRAVIADINVYEVEVVGIDARDFNELGLDDFNSSHYPDFEHVVLAPNVPPEGIKSAKRKVLTAEVVDRMELPDDHPYWDYAGQTDFPGGKDGWGSSEAPYSFHDLKMEDAGDLPVPKTDAYIIDKKVPKKLDTTLPEVDPDYRTRQVGTSGPSHPKDADAPTKPVVTGEPIDVISGAMVASAVDLSLPGVLPLEFQRSWSSTHADRLGPLGFGWRHSLDLSLRIRDDDVLVHWGDGRALNFLLLETDDASSFNRGAGLTLRREEGGYSVSSLEGRRYLFSGRRFDGAVPLVSIVDGPFARIDLHYRDGLLTSVTDSGGRTLRFVNNEDGFLSAVVLVDASKTELPLVGYHYDEDGHLIAVEDAAGNQSAFVYGFDNLITQLTDRCGKRFFWEYDTSGLWPRCTKSWGDEGVLRREFRYIRPKRTSIVTDSRGQTTTYIGNTIGMPARIIDPLGNEERFDYDEDGLLLKKTDALGRVTCYERDSFGRVISELNAAGDRRHYRYDEAGNLVEIVDEAGGRWQREYDERGRPVAAVDPAGARWSYHYDGRGQLLDVRDPLGGIERFEWDDQGNLGRYSKADGADFTFRHDALGRMVERGDPSGGVTRLGYDALGRLVETEDALGRRQHFSYDDEHNLTVAEGPDGRKRHYAYGPLNVPTSVRQPSGAVTHFLYDDELELRGVKDPLGRTWSFERDAAGRVVAEVGFDGRRLEYAYDAVGTIVAIVDARGKRTEYHRDAAGRVRARSFADGSREEFSYDALGRLVAARNGEASIGFVYDERGIVREEHCNGEMTHFESDLLGRRVGRTTPWGRSTQRRYDQAGNLVEVRAGDVSLARFSYDGLGREVSRQLVGGVQQRKGYDAVGQLLSVQTKGVGGEQLGARSYAYDHAGRVLRVDDQSFGTMQFEHDLDGRIERAVYPEQSIERFAWNATGDQPAAPAEQRVGADGGRQTRLDDWKLRWDEDGNLLEKQGREVHYTFSYDQAGRLSEVVRDIRVPASDYTKRRKADPRQRVTAQFAYDPLGRRVRRSERSAAGAVRETAFLWDGDQLLAERVAEGVGSTTLVEHVFGDGFAPLAAIGGEETWVFDCDFRDLPQAAFDGSGAMVWQGEFSAFGKLRQAHGPDRVPWRFSGQYADEVSGLYYNRFRYYDPDLKIFTQADPLGLSASPTPHGYVDDPFALVDPLGLVACSASNTSAKTTLTAGGKKKLGNLEPFTDMTAADAIRARGGTGGNVQQLATDMQQKRVGEIANLAAGGDREAETALKIVKQASKKAQKYGGK